MGRRTVKRSDPNGGFGESSTDSPAAVLFGAFGFVLLALRLCIIKVFCAALAEGRVRKPVGAQFPEA